ncbi:unnamed protein product [Mucor hiemalis]
MNFVKKQVGKGLHVPQMADKARDIGMNQISVAQKNYPFLNQRLPEKRMTENQKKKLVQKIENIAKGLDNIFPWSPIPIGLGTVLGFVPFIGGALGSLLSLYQIYLSSILGIPLWLLTRMIVNIAIAFLLSLIPVVGGLFHMFYRSNIYNFEELSKWLDEPTRPTDKNAPNYADIVKEGGGSSSTSTTTNRRNNKN